MSLEILIVPALLDLAVLMKSLMEENHRATISAKFQKGLLSVEEQADLDAELASLSQSGHTIQHAPDPGGSDVVIHTDRGYDIGLRRNQQGAYDVMAQWQSRPGEPQVNLARDDIEGRIRQKYAYEKVRRELARKGFTVASEEVNPDQSIRIVARKW